MPQWSLFLVINIIYCVALMLFDTLIIAYNNPRVLRVSLERLFSPSILIDSNTVTVFDNGSNSSCSLQIHSICKHFRVNYLRSDVNRGWGGSINYYLHFHNIASQGSDKYLLIMAHDSLLMQLNIDSIGQIFESDKQAVFVCPSYRSPRINSYNIFKSYYSRSGVKFGRVKTLNKLHSLLTQNFFHLCSMMKNFGYMVVNMKFS